MQLENTFTVPVDIDTVYDALNDPEKVTPCFPGATLTSADGDDFTGTVKVKLGPISMTYKGKGTFVERDKTAHKVVVDAQGRDSRGNGTASAKATLTMSEAGSGQTKVTVLTEMQVTGKPAQFGRGVMADVGDKILGQFASCLADEFADAPAPAASSGASSSSTSNGAAPAASSGAAPVSGEATPVSQPAAPTPVASASGAPEAAPVASTVAEARKENATAAKPGASPASGAGPQPVAEAPRSSSAERPKRQQAEAIDLLDSSRDAVLKRVAPVAAGVGVLALIFLIIRLARR
ncbi:SRPBCC family protein [Actinomycetospora sp. TBRC 11914]|uniref:SRPBCC family protein n=1 Tax=Actinomycetospora sp. TBRC 11914 TaxID=2729387 RepID=UPI00145CB895|nr:SRPBCC family protein [Actinomycetospora sp. TBRC 11914]NMO88938.1 carbon monoxide dehydrogenase [Actinomycetospora sp. TBRC 11914]